ncbi:MAG: hypothetical protein ACLUZ4_01445 [Christensenellaceae bacterium]
MEFVGKSCCAVAFYGCNARIAFKHSDKLGNCFLGSFSCFVLLGINSKQVFFNFLMRFVQNAQILRRSSFPQLPKQAAWLQASAPQAE